MILNSIDVMGQNCGVVVFPEYSKGCPNGKLSRVFMQDIADGVGRCKIDDSVVSEAKEKIPVLEQARNMSDAPCRRL